MADAACVADALGVLPGRVGVEAGATTVEFAPAGDPERALVELLDVLQMCLDEHGLPHVEVDAAGQTYTVRGPEPDGAGSRLRVISVGRP